MSKGVLAGRIPDNRTIHSIIGGTQKENNFERGIEYGPHYHVGSLNQNGYF